MWRITECYRQLGGGCRYVVTGPCDVEVVVDRDADGNLSGWVKGTQTEEEERHLQAAFAVVARRLARQQTPEDDCGFAAIRQQWPD